MIVGTLHLTPEELSVLSLEKLLAISWEYRRSCALHRSVTLDLFPLLGDSTRAGKETACRLHADRSGMLMFPNALTVMIISPGGL